MSLNERQISDREIKALQIAARLNSNARATCGLFHHRPDMVNTKCAPIHKRRVAHAPITNFATHDAKHIVAVEYVLMREEKPDGSTVVTETVKVVSRKTYTQDWKAYNTAQTHEKSELQALSFAKTCLSLSSEEARADHHYHCRTLSFRA